MYKKTTYMDHFMMLNLVNMRSFIRKLMKIWDPIQAYQFLHRNVCRAYMQKTTTKAG